jgi:LmbE family N-acetylglucosaminyl deacetylase
VLAVAAHPDDIEFTMAGTLLLLRQAGAEIHMWNLANGSCGTVRHEKDEIVRLRWEEARASARKAGARVHPPLVDDLALFYDPATLSRVAAGIRTIKPRLLMVPSPQDYMEDHQNACRLAVSAAFVRGMRNFATEPPLPPWDGDVTVYHAMPHGMRDGMRRLIHSEYYVDVASVLPVKRAMLKAHRTQKEWLDESQGMDAYLLEMEKLAGDIGRLSGRFTFAEGWRRHSHLGFSQTETDPLPDLIGDKCWIDPRYGEALE